MKKLLVLLSFLISSNSFADTGFNFMYSLGLTFGGETLAETTANTSLESGGLIFGSLGTVYKAENSNWQLQASLGYHFDTLEADDGEADFSRSTLEIVPFYVIDDSVRIGLGLMQISSISYTESAFGSGSDKFGFKNTTATVAEIGWRLNDYSWFSMRYIQADYELNHINGFNVSSSSTLDGSNFGLYYTAGF